MTAIVFEHFAFQLFTIGQIAVVGKRDAERCIHIEWLCFFFILGRTGCRVTDMADTAVSGQRAHIPGTENVSDQTVCLEHRELAVTAGGNTGSVLTAMLQKLQCIIDQLVDRCLGNNTNDATHGGLLNQKLRKQNHRNTSKPIGYPESEMYVFHKIIRQIRHGHFRCLHCHQG